jgi:hypothetical protein
VSFACSISKIVSTVEHVAQALASLDLTGDACDVAAWMKSSLVRHPLQPLSLTCGNIRVPVEIVRESLGADGASKDCFAVCDWLAMANRLCLVRKPYLKLKTDY